MLPSGCDCFLCLSDSPPTTSEELIEALLVIKKAHPWEFTMAGMGPNERKFYDTKIKRT